MTDTKILDRVRKLLAQAEHPSTSEQEAKAFSEKASKLAAEYALDNALIQAPAVTAGLLKPTTKYVTINAPYKNSKADILVALAFAHNCKVLFSGTRYTLIGFESDLELVEILYASLVIQALAAVAGKRPDQTNVWDRRWEGKGPAPGETKSFRIAFLVGFAQEVRSRLERIRLATTDTPGTDLVLVNRKGAVEDYYKDRYGKVRKAAKRHINDTGGGFGQGRAAGQRADIGQSRVGGRSAPALSR